MERAEPVPAVGTGRAHAVLSCAASSTGTGTGACHASTGTRQAGPGRFWTVLSLTVLVPAHLNRPVWPSITERVQSRCHHLMITKKSARMEQQQNVLRINSYLLSTKTE